MSNLNKLPEICYAKLLSTGELIKIKKGEIGYYPCDFDGDENILNEQLGVTKAQAKAMSCGSMFGWGVPGANPDNYDESGKLKSSKN